MKKFITNTEGQTALEYVLIIAVLILVLVAGIPPLREAVDNVFDAAIPFLNQKP
jgi:Flp pilus assembly pilin Flp